MYNIGEAAKASGVSSKMIRHYEAIGLLRDAQRTSANYRVYPETDLHQLRFIRRARELGFSIKQIGQLMSLWQDRQRSSADVRQLALAHVEDMDRRLQKMQEMRDALMNLVYSCHGDVQPECPILDALAEPEPEP